MNSVCVRLKSSHSKVRKCSLSLIKPEHCFIQTKVIVVAQMFQMEEMYRLMVLQLNTVVRLVGIL